MGHLEEDVISIIRFALEGDFTITPDTNLRKEAEADVFDMIVITDTIDQYFDVQLNEDDVESVVFVSDLVGIVKKALAARPDRVVHGSAVKSASPWDHPQDDLSASDGHPAPVVDAARA